MLASTSSSTRCIAISRSKNSPSAVESIDATQVGGSPSCLGEPPNRERPYRFRATSPRTCCDPSGSIDLDPLDFPGLGAVFTLCSNESRGLRSASLKRRCSTAWAKERSAESIGKMAMSYRIVFWSAVGWVALCLAPYVYALNDLITWR